MEGQLEAHAAVQQLGEIQGTGWLLRGLQEKMFATVPRVSSLVVTAREGGKETDFLVAVVADLATESLRFPRGKRGKRDLEEIKRHKRGFLISDA